MTSAPSATPDGREPHRRTVLVTGRLAAPALRRLLEEMQPPLVWDVCVLPITVAALMTTDWIARALRRQPSDIGSGDLLLLPGLCEGDPAVVAREMGVAVQKGPKDLRELPAYFGRQGEDENGAYGDWDIEIVAEINHAARLSRAELLTAARELRSSGADIIDLGCTPGRRFDRLGEAVRELGAEGCRVSVDTFDGWEIRAGVDAGAELVLSINGTNREVVPELKGRPVRVVVVPDLGGDDARTGDYLLASLEPTMAWLDRWEVPYVLDPVIEPIGHGFMASLERYAALRRRFPGVELLMGIGNVTELTAADSTGVNAILIAICQELGVRLVLTTEVMNWARGAVREVDVARRLMHHAVTRSVVPKHLDDRLVTLADPEVLTYSEPELRRLQQEISDPSYRIFTDRDTITVLNHERYVTGTDPGAIFAQLDVQEPSHAFYLGEELAKARLAIVLGKTYRQDETLSWGYRTPKEERPSARVRLTQGFGARSSP